MAKNFFEKQENIPRKERSISLNGAPMEELVWDYHDGMVQVPTTRSEETAPDVVVETQRGMNKQERSNISPGKKDRLFGRKKFTSIRPFKDVVKRQVKQARGVKTLPWPTSPKIYKKNQKILWENSILMKQFMEMKRMICLLKQHLTACEEVDLFDTICEWFEGDHLVIYCPYK